MKLLKRKKIRQRVRPGTFPERKDDSNVARISFPKNLLWGEVIDSLSLKYLLFHGHSRPSFPQPIHSQQPSTPGSLNQDPQKLPSSLMEAFSKLSCGWEYSYLILPFPPLSQKCQTYTWSRGSPASCSFCLLSSRGISPEKVLLV